MSVAHASFTSSVFSPDRLVVGNVHHLIARPITLISGQNLARGAVLGRITASGKYNLSLSAATDGSEVPNAILAVPTNASAGDVATIAYFAGEFNDRAITLGTAHTVASVLEGLRVKGIHLLPSTAA